MADKKVIIYSAPWCPWCRRTKEWFKTNKIIYEERDVDASQAFADEAVAKSGQTGIPVTDIDGQIIVGFDVEALKKELGL